LKEKIMQKRTGMQLAGGLLLGLAVMANANAQSPNPKDGGAAVASVPFISGGVGDEAQDKLNARAADYNLKLVFALTTGAYLSDVKVKIADSKGQTLLDTTSQGPWLFAHLPAGTYTVVSSSEGAAKSQTVSLASGKLRTVDFRW
jgi:hypothetical protein